MSFFKITDTTPPAGKEEVKHTDFETFYPAVNTSMKWKSFAAFVTQAEKLYIEPILGAPYYRELEAAYQNDEITETSNGLWNTPDNMIWLAPDGQSWGIDGSQWEILQMIRTASAYYTIYHAMPHITIRIGDAGTQETQTDNAMPVRQWVHNLTRKEACFAAYAYLDMAIELIKAEIEGGNDKYDTFKNSDAFTAAKELFLDDATEFNRFFNIKKSNKAYQSLIPYIRKAEQLYIEPLLGKTFLDELKVAFKTETSTLTTEQTNALTLIEKIKPYLAECVIVESTPEVNLINEGNGWKIVDSTDGIVSNKNAHTETLNALCHKAQNNASIFKMRLEAYLYQNLDLFPTFKASDYNKDKDYDPDAYNINEDPAAYAGGIML